jgi:excisionase family DNA binding protein
MSVDLNAAVRALVDERLNARVADEVERQLACLSSAPSSPFMTVVETADHLRCSRQRVYDLLSAGKLRRQKEGSRTLVLRSEVESLVQAER